jgi:AcrR family transcriptional regulator
MATRPARRTQAERRATTRAALLDAVLESLLEDGYAGITTRGVADRAGVSQGTQQHYFSSKRELVVEALRYAVQKLAADALRRIDAHDFDDPARQEAVIDELWRLHQSPTFRASLEVWNAARGDDDLRKEVRTLEREVVGLVSGAAREWLPDAEGAAPVRAVLDVCLAAIRGYSMLAPVVPQREIDARWAIAREHFVRAFRDALA